MSIIFNAWLRFKWMNKFLPITSSCQVLKFFSLFPIWFDDDPVKKSFKKMNRMSKQKFNYYYHYKSNWKNIRKNETSHEIPNGKFFIHAIYTWCVYSPKTLSSLKYRCVRWRFVQCCVCIFFFNRVNQISQ